MSNKFSHRRSHAKKPPICISKPPPKPYEYPPYPYAEYAPGDLDTAAWVAFATLPPVPHPPYDPITVRNLLFHCYPNTENSAWMSNLHQLRKRWLVFNGRKIIALVAGHGLAPPSVVKRELPRDADVLVIPNDPRLRETATFFDLLRLVRSTDYNEATFYAHSKGASGHHQKNQRKRLAICYWRNRMYQELLDHWQTNSSRLQHSAALGCFKMDYSCWPNHVMQSPTGLDWGTWHFAGNFYWFRHDCVFRNPHWSEIADDPYACEMWLGNLLPAELAATAYQPWDPRTHPAPDLYNPDTYVNPIA